MELTSFLSVISLGVISSASLTVAAHYLRHPRPWLIYIFKPLTTLLILTIAVLPQTFLTDPYSSAIALGLLYSVAGDIWLMLPGNRFLFGLVSFLFTHLCYAFAFFAIEPPAIFLWPLLPLMLVGLIVLGYLWPALSASLKGPVSLYVAAVVVMAALAVSRALAFISLTTLAAALGALLFLVSDAMLAIDRFRRPFRLARAAVLGSYYAGQLMIALSVGVPLYRPI